MNAMARPAFRACTVVKRNDGKDGHWLNVGVAFEHKVGEGLSIILQASSIDGKLVVRRHKEGAEDEKPKPERK
jgi:hypothetical protein